MGSYINLYLERDIKKHLFNNWVFSAEEKILTRASDWWRIGCIPVGLVCFSVVRFLAFCVTKKSS